MLAMAMGGTATACARPAQEEVPQETPEAPAAPIAPEMPLDSAGGPHPMAGLAVGGARGTVEGSVAGPAARLNVILAPQTWSGIDDLAAREAAMVRAIEALVTRVGGDSIAVIAIEVSPAIGAVRLTLPDSLIALALASRLRAMTDVTAADLDRREVRRHP
jgi:hypothetical protein